MVGRVPSARDRIMPAQITTTSGVRQLDFIIAIIRKEPILADGQCEVRNMPVGDGADQS
jgi:hypothetical protein